MPISSRFGRYEVEEEVARGGMGVIYRVRDPEMRRFLAMKVLLSDLEEGQTDSGSRHSKLSARFTDEAQLTGQLDHPGIIPVYDMGRDEEGRLFFTMRLVKGRTLEEIFDLVRDGDPGWSVTRAIGVLQKVCEAMGFAHERGVIHRDLKPANVMVGRFGETYVMDWGLAKLVDGSEVQSSVADTPLQTVLSSARKDESSRGGELGTLDGDVMGTPAYMAPEQARGDTAQVGACSDVYSLGAMLYHLLTGHPPFRPTGTSLSGGDVLARLLEGPPPAVESEAAHIPAELCAICERAMARDPRARYGTMLEVADDLQAYVEHRVVQAYRRGALIEFKKWVQRNRATAASLGAVFALVIAGLGAVSFVQTRARDEVEGKNQELAATNLELVAERERTVEARERAERNQALALENESIARANETEALWQSYHGNIAAAHAALEVGSASEARRRLAACPESLRDWEWRYLDQRADGSLRVLTGSETFITTLAVNPVATKVAAAGGMIGNSGSPDYAIRIWDFESGELEQELQGNEDSVASLAFAPAGDVLASSDVGDILRIWDVESGEVIAGPVKMGSRIAYHPNGRWIVGATYSSPSETVKLWDSYDLVELASATVPAGTNAVQFSPDGQLIALAGTDDHIRLLGLDLVIVLDLDASGEALASDRAFVGSNSGPGVFALDFSPDGRRLASGSSDGFVRTWDVATGERLNFFRGHRSAVQAVRWHPRFGWLVSSDESGSIRFWQADTGEALDVLRGHDEDVRALGFSALGDRLLSASRDATVRVWDGQSGSNDTILDGLTYPNFAPFQLAFAQDGQRVVWRSANSAFSVTDTRTGEDLCSIWTAGPFSLRTIAISGDEVWESSSEGRISRWNATTGKRISSFVTARDMSSSAYLTEERAVVLGTYTKGGPGIPPSAWLQLVDVETGEAHWSTQLEFIVGATSISPEGDRCLVQPVRFIDDGAGLESRNDGFAVFDLSTGAMVWETQGLPQAQGMAFFPDGKRFAHTTYNQWDNTLFIRSAETGELLDTFKGHAQPSFLDISPDGSRIVTGNWDGTISLWSPERGEVLVLPGHDGFVYRVGFSPDGQTLASLGDGGRRLWSATPVESRQTPRMSAARRRRWSLDARQRVDELLSSRVHSAAVVEALEADLSLRPEQRQAAVLLARSDPTSPADLTERSGKIGFKPGRSGAEYLCAMQAAKIAVELQADVAANHEALGAAQLRLGFLREALGSLDRAEQIRASDGPGVLPLVPFLKAMAQIQLRAPEASKLEYERGLAELRLGIGLWTPAEWAVGRELEQEVRELLGRE